MKKALLALVMIFSLFPSVSFASTQGELTAAYTASLRQVIALLILEVQQLEVQLVAINAAKASYIPPTQTTLPTSVMTPAIVANGIQIQTTQTCISQQEEDIRSSTPGIDASQLLSMAIQRCPN